MCVVIDANKAGDLCNQDRPYLMALMQWINRGGRIVSGGKLQEELFRITKMRELVTEWAKRGTLIQLPKDAVKAKEDEIKGVCKSDDPHVIAIAIISNARIVVTEDKKLIQDLQDLSIVGRRRRIYKENGASPNRIDRHMALLRGSDCP